MSKIKPNDQTDSDIVRLVISGDDNAYSVIVEKYEAKLLRYATFLVHDYDIASDVIQETFIKSYINLNSFNLNKVFSSWIYRILHNEAINIIKKNKVIPNFTDKGIVDDYIAVGFSTDKKLDSDLLKGGVLKCMSKMDIKYKEILMLYYFDQLKYDEISDVLRIPISTVGVRIKRAKLELKKLCQIDGVKYEE